MPNANITNPSQAWPFLLSSIKTQQQRDVAAAFYDMRLSFILPRKHVYAGPGKWFAVSLVNTANNTFTLLLQDTLDGIQDTVTYSQGVWQDTQGFLDVANCYIDTAQNVPQYQQLNLTVCASCLLLTTTGAKLTLCKGPVHRTAVDQTCSSVLQLQHLRFSDGYNTALTYKNDTLSVFVLPGVGIHKPFSYKDWIQYTEIAQSDAQIAAIRNGARSINGLTGAVRAVPGASVSITPHTSNKELTLQLAVNKVQT